MMNELIDKSYIEQCPLVLLYEGNIRTFEGRRVRILYNLLNGEPESLFKSKVAVKAVGKTAAKAMADGGATGVYADVIGEEAHSRLRDAGVEVDHDRKVNHQRFLEIWKQMGEIKD